VQIDRHIAILPGYAGFMSVISLRHVDKSFGPLKVLDDVSLEVARGEVVVVIGPSGGGKSTLCRVINKLEPIDSGEILINGTPLPTSSKDLAWLRADIGMVFQSFNLFAHKTILDNVTLGPRKVRKVDKAQAEADAMTLLERVGIGDQARKLPSQLSGGQQQRAAIARALAMAPMAMLFDEPTSALDPEMTGEVLDVIVDLAAKHMTMIVVTHEMGFARKVADRVVFMADGQLLEQASPEQFFERPETERARDFLAKTLHH